MYTGHASVQPFGQFMCASERALMENKLTVRVQRHPTPDMNDVEEVMCAFTAFMLLVLAAFYAIFMFFAYFLS
jgi:hypothetical protein